MTDNNLKNEFYEYEHQMEKWIQELSLNIKEPNRSEIEKILKLQYKDIQNLNTQDLIKYHFMLSQYGLFLQDQINKCKTFLQWARYNINGFLGQDKIRLSRWMQNIHLRIIRIDFINNKIDGLSRSINLAIRYRSK